LWKTDIFFDGRNVGLRELEGRSIDKMLRNGTSYSTDEEQGSFVRLGSPINLCTLIDIRSLTIAGTDFWSKDKSVATISLLVSPS